jgi:anti-sigma-K factor RskA
MAELYPHTEPDPDVAGYLLGTLAAPEAEAFAEHLPGCQACRSELAELAGLPGLLAGAAPAQLLPAGLEQRTFAAVEAAAAQSTAAQPAAIDTGTAQSATVVPIERARSARRIGPRRVAVVAAAAIVAVALGVGVLTSVAKRGQAPVATIRLISVTGGPAHATATVGTASGGLSIDMRVEGLPSSPPGTFYTCWLVGPGDTLAHQNRVAVGSFVVGAGGAVHVRWTTAADLHRFPHLGITVEPDNGDPRHQGPKVLTGP